MLWPLETARRLSVRAARTLRQRRGHEAGGWGPGYLSGGMLYSCKARVMMSLKTGAATELPK